MIQNPIFIAGLERSGTSLIFALLASHPNIAMTRRTNLWTYFYNQYGDLSKPENFERCLERMMRYKRLVKLEPDPERIRKEFWQGETTYTRLFALIEEHFAEKSGKPRWGDKSLNTERYADPILEAYPSGKILHMIRDPRDRYASVITRWGKRRGGVGAGMAMWLSSVRLAQRHKKRYPENYKIIRYELLASQPEETLREICEFVGEEYSAAMLTMEGGKTFLEAAGNSSYGPRESGVIYTNSVGRFRRVLPNHEIAFIQAFAGKEMLCYDYPLDPIEFSFSDQIQYVAFRWPVGLARMIGWHALNFYQNYAGRSLPSHRMVADPTTS